MTLVEFLEGNAFVLGFVTDNHGTRLEVWTPGKNGLKVNSQRILNEEAIPDPQHPERRAKIIEDKRLRRESLKNEVDLETLWDLLEGKGPTFSYPWLAELVYGREPTPDMISSVMRKIYEEGLRFKFGPGEAKRNDRNELDRLLAAIGREKKRKEEFEKAVLLLKTAKENRARETVPEASEPGGETPGATDESSPGPEYRAEMVRRLKDFALENEDAAGQSKTAKDLLAASGYPADPEGAADALSALGVFSENENIELLKLGLELEFGEEALAEAERLANSVDYLNEKRLDLTGEEVITIDSPGATEYDDAISATPLGNGAFKLGLHISDAGALVKIGSVLDKYAAGRGTSIYLPEGRYPMLPPELTKGVLSLNKGEPRPAFSILMTVKENGEISEIKLKPSLIKVDTHLSFDEANAILEGGEPGPLKEKLEVFDHLARLFLKKRLDSGGHLFNLPSAHVTLSPEGKPTVTVQNCDTPASILVGELMIVANSVSAMTLKGNNFPCPFRYQILNKNIPLPQVAGDSPTARMARHLALRRRLGRSGISEDPSRHWGLGINFYTYFTSPMRRYVDLLVHRQLRALAAGEGPVYDEKTLMDLAWKADHLVRQVHKVQNNRVRHWIIAELRDRVNETFKLLAFERQGKHLKLCLTDRMVETETRDFPQSVQPGDEVLATLRVANLRKMNLVFEYAGMP